ncbi:MAG TPA: hypothetical protein VFG38_19440 [Pseudomonadales bacterium]|nr:hypothetical protein [Pseudomonadales bacterium]
MPDMQDRSLSELIEIAKRAQTILGHLDLDAIANHDPAAVAKLASVADAIQALDNGEDVAFVPGVDENVAQAPVLDPRQVRRSELMELLDKAGYADRLGRIYVEPGEPPVKPLEFAPHQDGLPLFDICLAPDYSPGDGAHGIFISNRGVFSVMVPKPIKENRWRVLRSVPYENENELIDTVRRYIARPAAGEG